MYTATVASFCRSNYKFINIICKYFVFSSEEMSCTADEIEEKKRLAQERLKKTKEASQSQIPVSHPSTSANNATSPGTSTKSTSIFYGNDTQQKANTLNHHENKMKQQHQYGQISRIMSQPYPKRDANVPTPATAQNSAHKFLKPFEKVITCTCSMISSTRFQVITSGYSDKLIAVFKTIATRSYNHEKHVWSFDLSAYEEVQKKVSALNPHVVIGPIPQFVLKLLRQEKKELDFMYLDAIERTLSSKLLNFQKYGVAFAIGNSGRCMIADDMGLGKTFQAIAVADFYRDDWPLLIVTTATARNSWEQHLKDLLPSVPADSIRCLITSNDYIGDCKVLITSYSLMDKNADRLAEKRFGFVILDESHTIKNFKTKTANSATRICEKAKRVILLTGTPALSRPSELFCQLNLIDKKFFGSFTEYSKRYCDGRQGAFGWECNGSSNLDELNVVLQRKFMIRRTKESVEFELGEKTRETILLESEKVWNENDESMRETIENCKEYSSDVEKLKGDDRHEVLLRLYAESAKLKSKAVCSYVKDLVKQNLKFIVFGYHMVMLNALTEKLKNLKVDFIRIDGTTRNDLRSTYIDRFQNKKSCQVAVLSLKACNAAITLTAAPLVVFAELDWNPSTLAQCESRAHRIGQKSTVICRYLLAKGTADDYMWSMLTKKQDVLSKAGIFSEDLTDATHSSVTVANSQSQPNEQITNYLKPQDKECKENCDKNSNHNNNDEKKPTGDNNNKSPPSENKSGNFDHLLDDDDCEYAMLEIDF